MKTILITDTLFIDSTHEKMLRAAGFAIERLAKPDATEAELLQAIKGKAGYMLGGIEQVTKPVIAAADALEVIAFCGSGYVHFIPAWKQALKKGITITNVPHGYTQGVAEWAQAAALAMNRGLLDQTSGDPGTTPGLEGQTLGIVGLGKIGLRLAEMLHVNRPKEILYHSTHRLAGHEKRLGLRYATLSRLLQASDVVFLCVAGSGNKDFFGSTELTRMKQNALLVSFMVPGVINANALFEALEQGKIRAISDYPMDERFVNLPSHRWHSFQTSNAFNNIAGIKRTSDEATRAIIALLKRQKTDSPISIVGPNGEVKSHE